MRVFAVSDIHIDYEINARWVAGLSRSDYRDDVLILAGDVTDAMPLLRWCLDTLARRFKKLLFVPGNHDLWVAREAGDKTSLQKFQEVAAVVESSGASMAPLRDSGVSIIPLLGWYDYSFGAPSAELRSMWADYRACRWPKGFGEEEITAYFTALNSKQVSDAADTVITFSHFLPRIDLMPDAVPRETRLLYPILGAMRLEHQLRQLGSSIHIYGHSHFNRNVKIDGVSYINNAFGYPREAWIAARRLLCVHEC